MARPIFYVHLFCLFVAFVAVHGKKPSFRSVISKNMKEHVKSVFPPPPINPEFEVEVRYDDEESCVGVVVIRRTTKCPAENVVVSKDAKTDRLIKEKYGPDAFMVKISGPEVIRVTMYHVSRCLYQGRFRLSLPGPHVVHANHLYKNYYAMTEMHDGKTPPELRWWVNHPGYLFNRTLTKGIVLQCRTPVQDASVHNYIVEGRRQSPNEFNGQALPPSVILDLQRAKPPCSDGLVAGEGRWTLKTSIAPTPPTWDGDRSDAAAAAAWVWTPFNCSLSSLEFTRDDVYKCLKGKSVNFLGDSQQRSIFHKLANYFRDPRKQFTINRKVATFSAVHPLSPPDNSTTVRYDKDDMLVKAWANEVRTGELKSDAFLLGWGNWPAAGAGGLDKTGKMSLKKFKKEVDKKAASIEEYMRNNPNVSVWWVGTPAYPYPFRKDGRRSHERMRQMEFYAFESLQKRKVPIVDMHSITEGMVEYSKDHSHYTGFVAETMAAVVLQMLCQKWHPQTS